MPQVVQRDAVERRRRRGPRHRNVTRLLCTGFPFAVNSHRSASSPGACRATCSSSILDQLIRKMYDPLAAVLRRDHRDVAAVALQLSSDCELPTQEVDIAHADGARLAHPEAGERARAT